jgi:hypothetical protein
MEMQWSSTCVSEYFVSEGYITPLPALSVEAVTERKIMGILMMCWQLRKREIRYV